MANQKHLSNLDRIIIENGLRDRLSFKYIASKLNKDCTTISKEVLKNLDKRNSVSQGRTFNNCLNRYKWSFRYEICDIYAVSRSFLCKNCSKCRVNWHLFVENVFLNFPMYAMAVLIKLNALFPNSFILPWMPIKKYFERLSESRASIIISDNKTGYLNNLLYPLIVENGQSVRNMAI